MQHRSHRDDEWVGILGRRKHHLNYAFVGIKSNPNTRSGLLVMQRRIPVATVLCKFSAGVAEP